MTSGRRFEQELPDLLADLLIEPTPYYRDAVLQQTARIRQRPAWTIPERWLPMSVITLGRLTLKPIPWRTVGLLALLAVLLAAALAAYAGSRPRLPAPFGLAANGLIAYADAAGDIYAGDPITGKSVAIVTGPTVDSSPMYSPDGRRMAFLRQVGAGSGYDLVVAAADGSNAKTVSPLPLTPDDRWALQWAPDDGGLLANSFTNGDVRLYDANGKTEPRILAKDAGVDPGAFRPPLGNQILFHRESLAGTGLFVMDADGSNVKPLIEVAAADVAGDGLVATWSPDGSLVAFLKARGGDPNQVRINIIGADGSAPRELSQEPGVVYENHATWSPDGSRIAFQRWDNADPNNSQIMRLGIVHLAGGPIVDAGPELGGAGTLFAWSPDGSTLLEIPGEAGSHHLLVDPDRGSWDTLAFLADPLDRPSWQRLAP
jgi:Tol biopolymer transport system component